MTGETLIMAIRKFRKQMKPIIWLVTILMVLGGGYATLSSIIGSMSNGHSNYAFKLNGNKISKFEVEKTKVTMIDGYSRYLGDKVDRGLIDILAFDEVVNKNLTLEMADKLKVKVSSGDVNAQYDKIERLEGVKKNRENKVKSLKGYLKNILVLLDKKKIETELGNYNLRKSSKVEIIDISKLPEECLRIKQEISPDKTLIAQKMKNGEEIAGAVIVEDYNLFIK